MSDLKRTEDTAKIMIEYLGEDDNKPILVLENRLREKCAGELEGMPLGSTSSAAKTKGVDSREFKPVGGESWLDVNKRVHSFLNDVINNHLKN